MKQLLSNLDSVKKALTSIAQSSTGNAGQQIKCYHHDTQQVKTADYLGLEKEILKKKFSGQDYSKEYDMITKIPLKNILVYKLLEPMTIKGTKQVIQGDKAISPEIKNCTEIYIPEDIINNTSAGLMGEETGDMETDASGQEVPVINIDLGRCIIDVAAGKRDFNNTKKWLVAPRAFVTDISFRSMQIVGSLLAREKRASSDILNYLSDDQIN